MPGKKYSFDKIIESPPCPNCKAVEKLAVNFGDYMNYKVHDMPVEAVFRYLSEMQRERFFGTGLCSIQCADEYLGLL